MRFFVFVSFIVTTLATGGCDSDSDGSWYWDPDATNEDDDASSTPDRDEGRRMLCEACDSSDDCGGPEDLCLAARRSGEGYCSQVCNPIFGCPNGFDCETIPDAPEFNQCVARVNTCNRLPPETEPETDGDGDGDADNPDEYPVDDEEEEEEPVEDLPDVPTPDSCDPDFLGPFCEGDRFSRQITGFEMEASDSPTLAEVRHYSLAAVNYIRAMTCLPPLEADDCLDDIATEALEASAGHGYFLANCMNAAHAFGGDCECNWAQENIGMASGSGLGWTGGVQIPLCSMMEEPKGVGHRSNIESPEWTRLGVGISYFASGASWFHEFGR